MSSDSFAHPRNYQHNQNTKHFITIKRFLTSPCRPSFPPLLSPDNHCFLSFYISLNKYIHIVCILLCLASLTQPNDFEIYT